MGWGGGCGMGGGLRHEGQFIRDPLPVLKEKRYQQNNCPNKSLVMRGEEKQGDKGDNWEMRETIERWGRQLPQQALSGEGIWKTHYTLYIEEAVRWRRLLTQQVLSNERRRKMKEREGRRLTQQMLGDEVYLVSLHLYILSPVLLFRLDNGGAACHHALHCVCKMAWVYPICLQVLHSCHLEEHRKERTNFLV